MMVNSIIKVSNFNWTCMINSNLFQRRINIDKHNIKVSKYIWYTLVYI